MRCCGVFCGPDGRYGNELGVVRDGAAVPERADRQRIAHGAFPGRGDGIDEDEATGAAALLLTARLGRALTVTQGRGSQLPTGLRPGGLVEVGGRVAPVQRTGGVGSA